nr:D127 [uncultured bacterium]
MRAARKAIAFSVVHFFVGLAVAYALTGQAVLAASVALVEPAVNALIHFAYESWHDGHNGAMHAA